MPAVVKLSLYDNSNNNNNNQFINPKNNIDISLKTTNSKPCEQSR